MLRSDQADLILNDQRRAFSGEYVNLLLSARPSYIEVAARSPLAQLTGVTPQELKNTPCILITAPGQRETEQDYYRTVISMEGTFLYVENLEEARLMVIGRKGFLPVEGGRAAPAVTSVVRIPLMRDGEQILKNYCAFWKKSNANPAAAEFADILRGEFTKSEQLEKHRETNKRQAPCCLLRRQFPL